MSEECTHDCFSCVLDFCYRTQPQSLLAEANPESHVNRSKAQRKLIRQNDTIQTSRTTTLQQKTGLRDMALPLQPYPSALFLFLTYRIMTIKVQ